MSFTVPTIEWAGLAPVLIILGAGDLDNDVPQMARIIEAKK